MTPANVAEAVNFYQPHGIIHGCQAIRAEDASRTRVIGNFRLRLREPSGAGARGELVREDFLAAARVDRKRSGGLEQD